MEEWERIEHKDVRVKHTPFKCDCETDDILGPTQLPVPVWKNSCYQLTGRKSEKIKRRDKLVPPGSCPPIPIPSGVVGCDARSAGAAAMLRCAPAKLQIKCIPATKFTMVAYFKLWCGTLYFIVGNDGHLIKSTAFTITTCYHTLK